MQNTCKLDEFIDQIDLETWDSMSTEERLNVFQKFEDIMAEIEARPALEVRVISDEENKASSSTMGYFDGEAIHINPKFLKGKNTLAGSVSNFSMAKALGTIAHEGRHAWQQYVMKNPDLGIVDEKTMVEIMINNLGYYAPPDSDNEQLYLELHTLYQAQIVELDARRFQKQTLEYIEKKLEQRLGESNRVFKYAVTQCVVREVNEAERLLSLFTEEELMELAKDFREKLKQTGLFEEIDLSNISVFSDAIELLRSGDVISFVDGRPIQMIEGYKDVRIFDKHFEEDALGSTKTRITYRRKRKFR